MASGRVEVAKVFSLYRTYTRQIRKFPQLYLRQFLQLKARDDVETILYHSSKRRLEKKRLKRVEKEVNRLKLANSGHGRPSVDAFEHFLDLAYGRKGKLKHELMEPVVHDPTAPIPPKIIPAVEKSRPPAYGRVLEALMMDAHARMGRKPYKPGSWKAAALLPPSAIHGSEEAQLFGPFSKRREVNIQWRFQKKTEKLLYPPFRLVSTDDDDQLANASESDKWSAVPDFGLIKDIERLVGPAPPVPLTRKEMAQMGTQVSQEPLSRHPSLWVRRRYRSLLVRVPLVDFPSPSSLTGAKTKVKASISPYSLGVLPSPARREVDDASLAWLDPLPAKSPTKNGRKKEE
ncbi:hypothetical protein FA15DRAFT_662880 [Coprinopsis marcescibilis]|uniref:LYR motif-containing protein Cup1-like N-terminal domain-containing protein n=1 Tax=Coprinopsis marcescibilis TaxID=230819 RepID=A0A5C3LQ15_COPMA|nr:hypothetical protein FA15DRAFT_662880 [Coprinopsis marcescibilis]